MAKPKDPEVPSVTQAPTPAADPAGQKTAVEKLEGASVETLIEVLATATAQMQGLKGHQLKEQVRDMIVQVQQVTRDVEQKAAIDATRQQAVGEVQRLIEIFMQASQSTAKVLGPHRDAIAAMFRHVDFEKMSDGLKLINDYLQNPNEITEQQIKNLMTELQGTMGPIVGYDPAREDEQRREEIKLDVQARLDKIFRKPKPD